MFHPPEVSAPPPVRTPEATALFNVVLTSELLVNACWAKEQQGTAVANMALPTKRAIRHGLRAGRLGLDGPSLVALARPESLTSQWPTELSASVKAARICGQWFNAIEIHLAFELLGIGG